MPIQYGLLTKEQLRAFAPLLPDAAQAAPAEDLYAIGAAKDDRICGVLVFRADGEHLIDIQHIAVAEGYRRQGIAASLLDFLCARAWETTTAVLCTFAAAGWDDSLCSLFIRRGDFTLTEAEGYICRFPCKALSQVELSAAPPAGVRIAPFYALPEWARHRFLKEMSRDNPGFSAWLIAEREQMLRPLCLCAADSSDNIRAAVFCQGRGHDVELSFAYATPNHARSLIALVGRLRELLLGAGEHVSYLWIAAVTPQSRKLVDTLLPGREITEKFYTACWDMTAIGGQDDVRA